MSVDALAFGSVQVRPTQGTPVPESVTVCVVNVPAPVESLKTSEAVSLAVVSDVVDGINVSVTMQLLPAGTAVPATHVVPAPPVMVKSEEFVPVTDMLVKFRGLVPTFVLLSVTTIDGKVGSGGCSGKGAFTGTIVPNETLPVERLAPVPVPESEAL